MKKISLKILFSFLLGVIWFQFDCEALRSRTINGVFASTRYEIKLYDIRDLFKPYAKNVDESQKETPKFIFSIKPYVASDFDFDVVYENMSNILSFNGDGFLTNYEEKRIKPSEFESYEMGDFGYDKQAFKDSSSGLEGEYDEPVEKLRYYDDNQINIADERANLFDQFSPKVDKFLLKYGVKETIEHEGDAQVQISIFGEIKIKYGDEIFYFEPGLFQYTFYKNQYGHVCYHRAFRPIRSFQIIRLSRAGTRAIWCKVLDEIFALWPFEASDVENQPFYQQYLTNAEYFLKMNPGSDLAQRALVLAALNRPQPVVV